MKDNELVSIVVPMYHVPEKYLNKCLNSIINQTYKNLEILVMMNKEDNETVKLVQKYQKDHRLKIIYKNSSLSNARNEGEKIACGKYMMFVDGDDWIEKEMVEEMVNAIGDVDILSQANLRDYNGRLVKENYLTKFVDNKVYQTKEEIRYMTTEILDFEGYLASVNGKLFNLNFLKLNKIYHLEEIEKGCEGIIFNLLAFEKANKIKFINQYYYHYMYNDTSISTNFNDKNQEFLIKGFRKIKEIVEEMDDNETILEMYYIRVLYLIVTSAISAYFNPSNMDKYKIRKIKFKRFLNEDIIKESLEKADRSKLDTKRKVVLKTIELKQFWLLEIMGIIRKQEKSRKR